MLTLKDIAQHVGVSASTVSLVLNDRDHGRVNTVVAERIRRAADEMGYVPNLLARSLKTKQSHTLGVLSDGVASIPFAGPMLRGAQATAWNDGYLLMLIDTGGRGELDAPAVKSLMQRNIEGLILATEFHRFVDVPLVPSSIPTVVLDGTPATGRDDIDSVVPDEEQGAHDAVRYLLDHGHRRIAHLTVSDPRFVARKLRLAGYDRAMTEAGVEPDPRLVVRAVAPSTVSGYPVARELLERPDRPTAVFCFSDQLAFSVYQAAADIGLHIPEDLSVVGFDNQIFVADALRPGLTSVSLPHEAMGSWAVGRAIGRIRDANRPASDPPALPPHGERRLMNCPLVERESVAPAPPP
jgi:LacI family transcriptional regulator